MLFLLLDEAMYKYLSFLLDELIYVVLEMNVSDKVIENLMLW